jgi:hypothetical protein
LGLRLKRKGYEKNRYAKSGVADADLSPSAWLEVGG